MHKFMTPKLFLVLSQWTCPIHYFRSKTHVFGGSMPFRSRTWHVAKTGIEVHLMHKFMPLEPFLVFFAANMPIPLLLVSRHFNAAPDPLQKFCIGEHLMHEFMPPKPFLILSQPIHYFRSKTHVFGGSMPFHSRTWHVAKTGIEVHLMHEFMPLELFLVFCSKHTQSNTLDLKLMFWMVSHHFVAAHDPLRKLVSGCI